MKQGEIIRLEKTKDAVIGVLMLDDLVFCYTLEHPELLIDTGIYPAVFEYSPKFDMELYELKETGDRTEIKFHTGNTMDDTEGCILPGKATGYLGGKRAVFHSEEMIDKFHHVMKGEKIQISFLDITGI